MKSMGFAAAAVALALLFLMDDCDHRKKSCLLVCEDETAVALVSEPKGGDACSCEGAATVDER